MAVNLKEVRLAHEIDIAWLIALWLAIHGGDPARGEVVVGEAETLVAAGLIAQLSKTLGSGAQEILSTAELQERLRGFNVEMTLEEPQQRRPRQYCFKYRGEVICIQLPTVRFYEP